MVWYLYLSDITISRQDMAVILYRYARHKGYYVSATDAPHLAHAEAIKD